MIAMILKTVIIIVFLLIIASLGSALYQLFKHDKPPEQLVKALTWRIGLSMLLFLCLAVAVSTGSLKPTGLVNKIHQPQSNN